ncbi:Prp46p [Sugiyamaella lignohabitans]|uniref:Pre-mRNA-splicing factor PRP46 n=1 Tax=Sugiyamaella lignohabitans TaxID=796027 RepID=A0A167C3W8_9ASCO|nr:Prp46p [Sugiyamaella lignohabitans]ANB11185.1 Prp46p [Sugiyamaella lignohabitans]
MSSEYIGRLTSQLFPDSPLESVLDVEYTGVPRLRIRRKLVDYNEVKDLPQELADKLAQANAKKGKSTNGGRIKKRIQREKVNLGQDADVTTAKLIETVSENDRNSAAKSGTGSSDLAVVVQTKTPLQKQELPSINRNNFSAESAVSVRSPLHAVHAQVRPTWHPPWKLKRVLAGHQGWVRSVCVDPDNKFFATGSADRTIKIWDLASGRLRVTLTGHIMAVRGLVISPRHPYLFSAGEDKMVKCWDLEHNKVVRQYHGHLSSVYSVDLHPTLDLLVTAGRDSVARVWDIRTRHPVHVLTGHKATVSQVRCQSADPQVITTSMDSTVRLWDLAAGKTQTVLTHHKKSVRALTLHPTEFTFATGSPDNIKQWKFPEGAFMHNFAPPQNAIINTLSVNEDGVMFAGGDDGSMGFFDWSSGYKFQQFDTVAVPGSLSAESGIFASTFDRSGLRLITCEADKSVKIWAEDNEATEETHPLQWKPTL